MTDTWTPITTTNVPLERDLHTAIWTGNEMIVWGGQDGLGNAVYADGGKYDPVQDKWTPIASFTTSNSAYGRNSHSAIWTGNQMIVWGGDPHDLVSYLNDGGRYNLSNNTWTLLPVLNISPRWGHTSVWTGTEMIIWGGYNDYALISFNTGARYKP